MRFSQMFPLPGNWTDPACMETSWSPCPSASGPSKYCHSAKTWFFHGVLHPDFRNKYASIFSFSTAKLSYWAINEIKAKKGFVWNRQHTSSKTNFSVATFCMYQLKSWHRSQTLTLNRAWSPGIPSGTGSWDGSPRFSSTIFSRSLRPI